MWASLGLRPRRVIGLALAILRPWRRAMCSQNARAAVRRLTAPTSYQAGLSIPLGQSYFWWCVLTKQDRALFRKLMETFTFMVSRQALGFCAFGDRKLEPRDHIVLEISAMSGSCWGYGRLWMKHLGQSRCTSRHPYVGTICGSGIFNEIRLQDDTATPGGQRPSCRARLVIPRLWPPLNG